jgi:hypothetical protein
MCCRRTAAARQRGSLTPPQGPMFVGSAEYIQVSHYPVLVALLSLSFVAKGPRLRRVETFNAHSNSGSTEYQVSDASPETLHRGTRLPCALSLIYYVSVHRLRRSHASPASQPASKHTPPTPRRPIEIVCAVTTPSIYRGACFEHTYRRHASTFQPVSQSSLLACIM